MDYNFLNSKLDKENFVLPESEKINPYLVKNNTTDIIKALEFLDSEGRYLYIHGFLGTGKRQFVDYLCEFLDNDVIKLEYFCKESTVCDDILLEFNEIIENSSGAKNFDLNAKITTLGIKFQKLIGFIKKPILITLHSLDNVSEDNMKNITDIFSSVLKEENVKIIITTRALKPNMLGNTTEDTSIFLKALKKEIFEEFIRSGNIEATDKQIEDLYKLTRGYYYYTALSIKLMQGLNVNLGEFIEKIKQSNVSFDAFIGLTYINQIPNTIRNFFWFLKTLRHGISLNALAILEVYDEFSIDYLKTNLLVFQADDKLYVHDYFIQKVETMIPAKTEIKLHKYLINIYENQLKEPIKTRSILLSRQALRAEIEYHNGCIQKIENPDKDLTSEVIEEQQKPENNETSTQTTNESSLTDILSKAEKFTSDKKYTEAIEIYNSLLESKNADTATMMDIRLKLARLYKTISDYSTAQNYFELIESYYKQNNEVINLNYLYYELTDLYHKMYKNERAIETAKKVIYSVDTPQSLMVSTCTLLGNIFSDINNPNEAFTYYKKAIESLDNNVNPEVLSELYFKFALANDDKNDTAMAFEYYDKCIGISGPSPYKSLAYSNIASCYYDRGNMQEALNCFNKAYNIEKENNNYDGLYYVTSSIADIYRLLNKPEAFDYLIEAKKCAEFINEEYYIIEASIALGDYYYNNPQTYDKALKEYFNALKLAKISTEKIDISVIEKRVEDMKLRMPPEEFSTIESKYEK